MKKKLIRQQNSKLKRVFWLIDNVSYFVKKKVGK